MVAEEILPFERGMTVGRFEPYLVHHSNVDLAQPADDSRHGRPNVVIYSTASSSGMPNTSFT